MINILHDSNLKITSLVQNFMEKTLISQNNEFALTNFTDNLQDVLMELGRNITKEVIETVEEAIFESSKRKKKYASEIKANRNLITIFGEISFKRRLYYELENTTEKHFLTDCCLDILESERMLKDVEEKLILEAVETSYENASSKAAYGVKLSKQTVKNKISKLNFNVIPYKIPDEKRKLKSVYIQADEDHVALQEGGCSMPRIVTIHEGSENGKLVHPYTICGLYEGDIDALWEYVLEYIENVYDYEYIDNIFVLGDGANWIKTSIEWLPKAKYIADKFHIFKALNAIAGKNQDVRELLKDSIFKLDFDEFEANCETIIEQETNKNKKECLQNYLKYILNNQIGIKRFILWDLPGCSAEGYVSHILSARLSSRPLGWSKQNVDNMSRLRAMKFNKEDIKIITRNKLNLNEKENKELEYNKIVRSLLSKKKTKSYAKTYGIPELQCSNSEYRQKLKELLDYKIS